MMSKAVVFFLFVTTCCVSVQSDVHKGRKADEEAVPKEKKRIGFFSRLAEEFKFKPPPPHETAPTQEVKDLVEEYAQEIKQRAKLPLVTEQDKKDLAEASVNALGFVLVLDGEFNYFYIRVIIGNEHIVHVKISQSIATKKKKAVTTLMIVVGNKSEEDKLDEKLFE